jgi:hypothetical protein
MKPAEEWAGAMDLALSTAAYNHPAVHGQGLPGGAAIPILETWTRAIQADAIRHCAEIALGVATKVPTSHVPRWISDLIHKEADQLEGK